MTKYEEKMSEFITENTDAFLDAGIFDKIIDSQKNIHAVHEVIAISGIDDAVKEVMISQLSEIVSITNASDVSTARIRRKAINIDETRVHELEKSKEQLQKDAATECGKYRYFAEPYDEKIATDEVQKKINYLGKNDAEYNLRHPNRKIQFQKLKHEFGEVKAKEIMDGIKKYEADVLKNEKRRDSRNSFVAKEIEKRNKARKTMEEGKGSFSI